MTSIRPPPQYIPRAPPRCPIFQHILSSTTPQQLFSVPNFWNATGFVYPSPTRPYFAQAHSTHNHKDSLTYHQNYGRIIDVPYSCSRMNQSYGGALKVSNSEEVFDPAEQFGILGHEKYRLLLYHSSVSTKNHR